MTDSAAVLHRRPAGYFWSASSPCSMQPSLLAFWGGFHSSFQLVSSASLRLHHCTVSGWGAGLGASLSPWGTSCRISNESHCPSHVQDRVPAPLTRSLLGKAIWFACRYKAVHHEHSLGGIWFKQVDLAPVG